MMRTLEFGQQVRVAAHFRVSDCVCDGTEELHLERREEMRIEEEGGPCLTLSLSLSQTHAPHTLALSSPLSLSLSLSLSLLSSLALSSISVSSLSISLSSLLSLSPLSLSLSLSPLTPRSGQGRTGSLKRKKYAML